MYPFRMGQLGTVAWELLPGHKQIMVLLFMIVMGSLAYSGVLLCNMYAAYARFFKFKVCATSHTMMVIWLIMINNDGFDGNIVNYD